VVNIFMFSLAMERQLKWDGKNGGLGAVPECPQCVQGQSS